MPPRRSGSSNLFAVFAHLGCFFFPILVPLVIYLLTKDEPGEQFAAGNARESLNFQITLCIAGMVCGILIFAAIGLFCCPCWAFTAAFASSSPPSRRPTARSGAIR